ncbi:MAG TPA: ATP-binding cassette domain-containing protein [Actinoplanes sp.]|nr:ATP-binding cassette domain-containing protein [Actinoplanes sp.]
MRFDKVWFRYARRAPWTLQDVDVTVLPGRATVVLGRNGAGKSTLLQLAAGVLSPSRGVIRDRPRIVGWVPERFPAAQPFTTLGYLRAMAEVRGLPPGAADPWIDRLHLTAHVDTQLPALSKGTAQKVGLAQALLTPPGLLVLDEPWEGLDAQSRELVPQLVAEVTAAGGSVLVSDHRGEIATLPDALHWTVSTATVTGTPGPADSGDDEMIIEIAVRRDETTDAVDRLSAAGHRVLGVREKTAIAVRVTSATVPAGGVTPEPVGEARDPGDRSVPVPGNRDVEVNRDGGDR